MKVGVKKIRYLLKWSLLHAVWLVALTFFDLRMPHTTDEEMKLIQWTSAWKRIYLQKDRPPSSRFLFVNVAWEKQSVPKLDGNGFVIGNDVITDRKKLTAFFELLNQRPDNHAFLLVDIRFEERFSKQDLARMGLNSILYDSLSFYDSLLSHTLANVKRYMVSYHADVQGRLRPPVFPLRAGLSNYETTDEGTVVKFSTIQADTARTTPLLIYQALTKGTYRKGFLFDIMNGVPVLNSFILDHRVLLHPWEFDTNGYYAHTYLSEMLQMPAPLVHEMTKGRIIVLGDFQDRDIHETIYGAMPGPVILVNAFLALENQDNRITIGFILFLLTGYTFISYRCFSQTNFVEHIVINRLPLPDDIKKMVATMADYLLLLILLSIISYFLFNVHLTILLLAIYMQVLEWVIAFIKRRKNIKLYAVPETLKINTV
jgi:hypothetical protein